MASFVSPSNVKLLHRADNHATAHELTDGVAHVFVISAKAINPTDNNDIPEPQLVEQTAALGTLDKAGVET
jgi:hypothetical protein